jgi:ketosteroid isomerase-like protein
MSRENIELAAQAVDALGRRDADCLIRLVDAEVEWRSFFAELGEGGVYRGSDGIRQYLSDLDDAFEILRGDIDEAIGVGDVVVLIGHVHYRGKASGIEAETTAGWMFKFHGSKIVRFRAFPEPEQALESVGLEE